MERKGDEVKIKSIVKVGPDLFLITYSKLFREEKRRVIARKASGTHKKVYAHDYEYFFRDGKDYLYQRHGTEVLEWMIKNNVTSFDNETGDINIHTEMQQ